MAVLTTCSEDTMNSTNIKEPFTLLTSQLCGVLLLIISTLGLIFYILFIWVVFARPRFKNKTYFVIAGWLGIADCMCLFLMIGYASPCLFYRKNLSNSLLLGGILNIGWFSGLFLILVLGADRYLCICNKDGYTKFYTKKMTAAYCIVCWVIGIAYSFPSFFSCCPLYFEYILMSWGWSACHSGSKVLALGEITMVILITSLTYILNGLVFKTIREAQRTTSLDVVHEQRKNARERKVFIQFFITTIWLVIFDIPFITIGYIKDPSHWLGFFVTISYTINCSVNGWVYCFMNKTIQREVREIFRRGHRVRTNTTDNDEGQRGLTAIRTNTVTKMDVEKFRIKNETSSP